ncbi:MAG: endonuclease/exonuclease/phosphatase family protein [Acidobacteriota bacterium]
MKSEARPSPRRLQRPASRASAVFLALALGAPGLAGGQSPAAEGTVRIAQFNVWELGTAKIDHVDDAGGGHHPQLLAAAAVIRRIRPDVLLLNEIDYDADRDVARAFIDGYLKTDGESPPIDYPHVFTAPVNTGVPSGYDLDNNGALGDPDDAWGFGRYPGQYGMALLSRWPLDDDAVRSFRALRWITMPGHRIPDGRDGRPAWYSAEEAALLRLSSKSFWDVPLEIPRHSAPPLRLHILASHPTPPVFDGDEDRNGRRNFDEIRLVADYLSGGESASWMVDDLGRRGGFAAGASAVVMGDLNADPVRGEALGEERAIDQLLDHPRLQDPEPRSAGDLGVDPRRGAYPGDSRTRTSGFGRIDYVLPTKDLRVRDAGVFVPVDGDPLFDAVRGGRDRRASDHFLVWVDLDLGSP